MAGLNASSEFNTVSVSPRPMPRSAPVEPTVHFKEAASSFSQQQQIVAIDFESIVANGYVELPDGANAVFSHDKAGNGITRINFDLHDGSDFAQAMQSVQSAVEARIGDSRILQDLMEKDEWSLQDRTTWESMTSLIISEEVSQVDGFDRYKSQTTHNADFATNSLNQSFSANISGQQAEFDCDSMSLVKGVVQQRVEGMLPEQLQGDYYFVVGDSNWQPELRDTGGHAFIMSAETAAVIEATDPESPYRKVENDIEFDDFLNGDVMVSSTGAAYGAFGSDIRDFDVGRMQGHDFAQSNALMGDVPSLQDLAKYGDLSQYTLPEGLQGLIETKTAMQMAARMGVDASSFNEDFHAKFTELERQGGLDAVTEALEKGIDTILAEQRAGFEMFEQIPGIEAIEAGVIDIETLPPEMQVLVDIKQQYEQSEIFTNADELQAQFIDRYQATIGEFSETGGLQVVNDWMEQYAQTQAAQAPSVTEPDVIQEAANTATRTFSTPTLGG